MRGAALRAASSASLLLFPVLLAQGMRVRRTTPRLPEAPGPRKGLVGDGPPLHLLMIGESTAAGVGAESHADGLPGLTARALADHSGHAIAWRVLGRNGATALATRTDLLAPAEGVRADVAVIVLGVNDTLRFHSPARWRRDLAALVEAVRERCGPVPVVLAGVPPMGLFPALPQPLRGVLGLRAALLDHTARRLADELPAVRHVGTPALDASVDAYFCADRFHPSPRGYAAWAAALGAGAAALVATKP
ncbi:MAG TPA: SGNH/GDSL hydrolase family protein [Longimicrobium sp.]|nr:SGNH/GDSL hydrolase family protein [Longimicrobium sp.]